MSLFRGRESRQWAPEPIIPPFPGVDMFGGSSRPSMQSALQVSAVWACVRLLGDAISMMPLHQFTITPGNGTYDGAGVRMPLPDPPFLTQPGGDANMTDWLYMLVVSLLLRGNAYGVMSGMKGGYPTQIDLMNPDQITVRSDAVTGRKQYYGPSGNLLDPATMWHMRAYRMPGSVQGLSPIAYAASTINTEGAIGKFALGYFNDAPHPPSTLTSDQQINEKDARTILDRILAKKERREPLVLGSGLKFQTLAVSPEESQFLNTQKWNVASIARIFGVPPEMIAAESGNSMTYANTEMRALDFLTYSVQPWLTRIEAALAPLFAGKQHPRFDTSILLRTDLETRLRSGGIAIASKVATPDEVRAWSDDPPLTEEQKTLLDLIPLTISPTGRPTPIKPGAPAAVDFSDPEQEGVSDAPTP